jgi:Catalase
MQSFPRRRRKELYAEYPQRGEEALFERLARAVNALQQRSAAGGPVFRGLHANAISVLHGEVRVRDDLPEEARFGFLARGARFPVVARFSGASHKPTDEAVPDFYGLAIRIGDVAGGGEQDLVMTNKPRATARDAAGFKALIDSTERGALPRLLFALRHPATARLLLGARHPVASVANETYWSGDPIRWGPRVAKYVLKPAAANDGQSRPGATGRYLSRDELAAELRRRLSSASVGFTFSLQFQADPYRTPIENGLVLWSEEDAPPVPVADVEFEPQEFDTAERREEGEALEFSVWNCLDDSTPVGQLNRARRVVYAASQRLRRSAD